MDAKNGVRKSLNGADDQAPESPPSLVEAISQLVATIHDQNQILMDLVRQNAMLIGEMVDEHDDDGEPSTDMSGYPIRLT